MKFLFLIALFISSSIGFARPRKIDVDIFRSSDHTKVWDLPDASDTLIGRDSIDSLSHKTLIEPAADVISFSQETTPTSPAAGKNKLYFKSNDKLYLLKSDGTETAVGTGSGGGSEKNYLAPFFDASSTDGINTYNDGASSTPTDGTGGTVTGLSTAIAVPGIRPAGDITFSKDASNRQGEGWSIPISIDEADRKGGQPLYISTRYKTSSAYASGDLRMFVYDVDSSVLLPVYDSTSANHDGSIQASTDSTLFTGYFTPVPDDDDYRLISHITSTNASAYDFHWIDGTVKAQSQVPVPAQTPWKDDICTSSWVTNTTVTCRTRRVGENIEINFKAALSGAPNATQFTLVPPTGIVCGKTTTNGSSNGSQTVDIFDSSASSNLNGIMDLIVSSNAFFGGYQSSVTATKSAIGATAPITFATGDYISGTVSCPVVGWNVGASLSTDAMMQQTGRAKYSTSAGQSISNNTTTIVNFDTKSWDDNNNVTTGASWKYTSQKNQKLLVCAAVLLGSSNAWSSGEYVEAHLYKNGSDFTTIFSRMAQGTGTYNNGGSGCTTIDLVSGDYFDLRFYQNSGSTIALHNDAKFNWIDIIQLPDFTTYSVYGPFEIQTWDSTALTPGASGNYYTMSGNCQTLPVGTWELYGTAVFGNSGSAPAYGFIQAGWYAANGNNTNSTPTALTFLDGGGDFRSNVSSGDYAYSVPHRTVRFTAPTSVCLDTFATMTTAANARITIHANARRLQ